MSHTFALHNGFAATVETTNDSGMVIVTMLETDTVAGMAVGSRFATDTADTSLSLMAVESVDYVKGYGRKTVTVTGRYCLPLSAVKAIAYARAGESPSRVFGTQVDHSEVISRVVLFTD